MSNTMKIIRTFFFGLVLGGGLLFQSAAPAFGQSEILRGGRYDLDRSASDSIDQAIQSVVAELDPQTSSILVWKLKNSNTASEHVVLTLDSKEVSVQFDSLPALKSPINGQVVTWTSEILDDYDLITRLDRGVLVQIQARDGEYITRTYTEDLKTLTIQVVVAHRKLPAGLTYRLVYNRAS